MLLVDKKGNKKQRVIQQYGKTLENGLKRALIVFKEPKDVACTALLTWELEDGQNKQWLYLPGQKKFQRIASQSKKSYFLGTDFTFEDMHPDIMDNFKYTILRTEALDEVSCKVIEVVPATREKQKESAYAKRLLWVRTDIFFILKIEFYNRRGKLIKTQTSHNLTNLEGDIWMANKVMMNNHKTKHKTLMGVKKRTINIDLEDSIFTERFIMSGKHCR